MFELFKYFLYLVRDNLDNYDPLRDKLVESSRYLTWRRYNDEVPHRGIPYAGVIWDKQLKKWVVLRFNPRLYFEEVEDWLTSQQSSKPTLGAFHPSVYRSLLRAEPPYSDIPIESWYLHMLPQFQAFFKEHWGSWPSWLSRELEEIKGAEAKLKHLHGVTSKNLIDEGGVVL